ncbi:MAG TPA: glycosyltransferase [bacterium]|nr:glycosyltransferase [bacterium]
MIKTSVIITVYNRRQLLRNCLISLIHQSQLPDELIISDDGSQEDIREILYEMAAQMKFILKYVRQPNRGFRLARCRNNGVRFSQGDYLIFLDQDLIFTKNLMATFIDNYHPQHFNVCYPLRLSAQQTRMIDDNVIRDFNFDQIFKGSQLQKINRQYRKDKFYSLLKRLHVKDSGAKFRGGAVGINRADFEKINGYDENYIGWGNEDDDLGRRLYRIGVRGRNISDSEFPIHLHHHPFHINGERVNHNYYQAKKNDIDRGKYQAKNGLDNPDDTHEIVYQEFSR